MNKLKRYVLAGTTFVIIIGIVSHFVYELSGNNFWVGFFFPVSESTLEHMKLCFFPMLLYALFMNKKLKADYPCVTSGLLAGILTGTFLIPVIFYTYSGALGKNFLFLDILTFILSIVLAFAVVYRLTLCCKMKPFTALLKLLVLIVGICFLLFTYLPPDFLL